MQRSTSRKKPKTWKQRMEKVDLEWEGERETLLGYMKENAQISGLCFQCDKNEALLFCKECNCKLCPSCDIKRHYDLPFHNRKSFVSYLEPLPPHEALTEDGEIFLIGKFNYHLGITSPYTLKLIFCNFECL